MFNKHWLSLLKVSIATISISLSALTLFLFYATDNLVEGNSESLANGHQGFLEKNLSDFFDI